MRPARAQKCGSLTRISFSGTQNRAACCHVLMEQRPRRLVLTPTASMKWKSNPCRPQWMFAQTVPAGVSIHRDLQRLLCSAVDPGELGDRAPLTPNNRAAALAVEVPDASAPRNRGLWSCSSSCCSSLATAVAMSTVRRVSALCCHQLSRQRVQLIRSMSLRRPNSGGCTRTSPRKTCSERPKCKLKLRLRNLLRMFA